MASTKYAVAHLTDEITVCPSFSLVQNNIIVGKHGCEVPITVRYGCRECILSAHFNEQFKELPQKTNCKRTISVYQNKFIAHFRLPEKFEIEKK